MWTAQGAYITWGESGTNTTASKDNVFAAMNSITVTFQRMVDTRYPIGGSNPIQLVGAPTGQLVLNTLIGPTSTLESFLRVIGKSCTPVDIKVLTNNVEG